MGPVISLVIVLLQSLVYFLYLYCFQSVMMPAYMKNRYYAIFFITFTVIGKYMLYFAFLSCVT